jgi:hypothetical protein
VRWIPDLPRRWGLAAALGLIVAGCAAPRSSSALLKVLPHYLDQQGRSALAPSLYDRDAYQAQLRKDASQRTGLRFDVQWRSADREGLILQMEVRGVVSNRVTQVRLYEPLPKAGRFSRWSEVRLDGDRYRELGELTAWRASLWQGTNLLAEQRSFLW